MSAFTKESVVSLIVSVFSTVFFCGCQNDSAAKPAAPVIDAAKLDGARALSNVVDLVKFTPRNSGSPGAEKAALYLKRALKPYVDGCTVDEFEEDTPRGHIKFHNVVGMLLGSGNEIVIIASHYDTKTGIADFQGANDSGSSSGLLLEIARLLKSSERLPFSVIYLFTDGEECIDEYAHNDGLHGSRRMVRLLTKDNRLRKVKAFILLDMVGDSDLTLTLPRNADSRLKRFALEAARDAGIRKKVRMSDMAILDDHVPFLKAGVPAVDLIDFSYGSASGLNDYWHTSADSLEHISARSLHETGAITLGILNRLASD